MQIGARGDTNRGRAPGSLRRSPPGERRPRRRTRIERPAARSPNASGPCAKDALHRRDQFGSGDCRDWLAISAISDGRDAGPHERLVGTVTDTHQLVGGEIVVEIRMYGQTGPCRAGDRARGSGSGSRVPCSGLARVARQAFMARCEDVRRVVGHQVPDPVYVVAPAGVARGGELYPTKPWPADRRRHRTQERGSRSGSSDHSSRRSSVCMNVSICSAQNVGLVPSETPARQRLPHSPSGTWRPRPPGDASSSG